MVLIGHRGSCCGDWSLWWSIGVVVGWSWWGLVIWWLVVVLVDVVVVVDNIVVLLMVAVELVLFVLNYVVVEMFLLIDSQLNHYLFVDLYFVSNY